MHLVAVKPGVHVLTPKTLHRAHGVDAFGQRAIDRRIRLMRLDERLTRQRQPEDAHDKQDRQHGQGDRAKTGIEVKHQTDDAEQQHDIADRENRGFQKLLHRADVALQTRHQAANFGFVHKGQGNPLKMRKHRPANIEKDIFGGAPDQGFLHMACRVIHHDHRRQHRQPKVQDTGVLRHQTAVDDVADDHRDRQLGQGEDQHRPDRDQEIPPIGHHERPDPVDDLLVKDLAEHYFFDAVAADHGAQGRRARGGFPVGLIVVIGWRDGHDASRSDPSVCRSYSAR